MVEQTETLVTKDGPMGVHIVRPDGDGPFPVVVYFHHGPGLDDGSKESMARIADGGYYVISHDRYHRDQPWLVVERGKTDDKTMERFWEILMGTTDGMVASDLDAVLAYVDGDPAAREAPMGAIGFCIGGRSVLRTIADHPDRFRAGVGFHPSYTVTEDADSPHLAVPDFTGSIYLGYGADDTMQSPESQQALIDMVEAMGDRGQVEIHDGANHGYSVPGRAYHAPAADRSYEQALAVFDKEL
ncbi:MAG TPA: dienelactone hydrolase family protein [Acidimicrobiales bacterium]